MYRKLPSIFLTHPEEPVITLDFFDYSAALELGEACKAFANYWLLPALLRNNCQE